MPAKPHPLLEAVAALGWPEIARSSQGRPIVAQTFGSGERPLIVVAGVHGDEPSTVEAALDLAIGGSEGLAAGASSPDAAGDVVARWAGARGAPSAIVVPALNPDGIARGRKNTARNVDLNRNFPAGSFTLDHRPGYFPGERPLSEPESRALAALVDRVRPRGVIAIHAPLACVNHDGPAAAWAERVAAACGWPARADIGYPTPGSLGSWLGVDRGLPVLTLEFPPGAFATFAAPARAALLAAINRAEIG